MNRKVKLLISVFGSVLIAVPLYIFLHEGGHAYQRGRYAAAGAGRAGVRAVLPQRADRYVLPPLFLHLHRGVWWLHPGLDAGAHALLRRPCACGRRCGEVFAGFRLASRGGHGTVSCAVRPCAGCGLAPAHPSKLLD